MPTQQILRQFCSEMNGTYIEGVAWHSDRAEIKYKNYTIVCDANTLYSTASNGSFIKSLTRLKASLKTTGDFNFTITPSNVIKEIARFFGAQDVNIGIGEFDKKFTIKANNEKTAQQFFDNQNMRELLSKQDSPRFLLTDHEGYYGDLLPKGIQDLVYIVDYVVKDLEELRSLFELVCVGLDQLEKIKVAGDLKTSPEQ